MINNFELIKSLLTFSSDDIYYHLQVIQRKKDCPEIGSNNRVIKSYFICKLESLEKIKQEVINLCKLFNARAYINVTPKSLRKTTLLQIKYLSKRLYVNDLKKIWKSWNSCAGEIKGEEPRWIVDIDHNVDDPNLEPAWGTIADFIDYKCDPKIDPLDGFFDTKIIVDIPTKNGYHLITTPFNLQQFKEKYPDIDVHKNNSTLLYCL